MKSFFIKLGKAWNVLRRDGLIAGTKRIFSSFFQLFGTVATGDVLFITNGVGDSARYRARYVAEELTVNGFRASVTVQDNPFLSSYVNKFSVFVFHRTLVTPRLKSFIERLKKAQKEMVFDTDDLTYDPIFLPYMAGYEKMNALERKLYDTGLAAEIVNDPYVKRATTTTTYLADELRKKGKEVFLVRNKMSRADRELTDRLVQTPRKKDDLIRIAYFSGTASHNKDFATITEPLIELLEKYPQVRLVLVGPLDTEHPLQRFASQIEKSSFVPWDEHFAKLAAMDINLAPLEIGNPFCEAKSELKFFEAGIVKVPTVAAATRTFREAIADGVDGFVALSPAEWREKIEKLILDPELRQHMGEKARETALARHTTENSQSEEYYSFLWKVIKHRT